MRAVYERWRWRRRRLDGSGLRRLKLAAALVLGVGGTLAVADAALTVTWQEPVSAYRTARAQDELATRYALVTARWAGEHDASRRRATRVRTAGRLDVATRAGEPLGRLRAPRMGLDLVWVQGTSEASLAEAPGHYKGTVLPGARGTVGIAGHRTTHGAPFRHIDRLRAGDRIDVSMPYGRYGYRVERTRIVSPNEAEVLRKTSRDRLVLTACHPLWSARQRIVVIARLVRRPKATPKPRAVPVGLPGLQVPVAVRPDVPAWAVGTPRT